MERSKPGGTAQRAGVRCKPAGETGLNMAPEPSAERNVHVVPSRPYRVKRRYHAWGIGTCVPRTWNETFSTWKRENKGGTADTFPPLAGRGVF